MAYGLLVFTRGIPCGRLFQAYAMLYVANCVKVQIIELKF